MTSEATGDGPLRALSAMDDVEAHRVAVVYKHSGACWSSTRAQREVELFATAHPEIPVYIVDVLRQRALSDVVAERTGIAHESPQTIVFVGGRARWSTSHRGISAASLASHLDSLQGG